VKQVIYYVFRYSFFLQPQLRKKGGQQIVCGRLERNRGAGTRNNLHTKAVEAKVDNSQRRSGFAHGLLQGQQHHFKNNAQNKGSITSIS